MGGSKYAVCQGTFKMHRSWLIMRRNLIVGGGDSVPCSQGGVADKITTFQRRGASLEFLEGKKFQELSPYGQVAVVL